VSLEEVGEDREEQGEIREEEKVSEPYGLSLFLNKFWDKNHLIFCRTKNKKGRANVQRRTAAYFPSIICFVKHYFFFLLLKSISFLSQTLRKKKKVFKCKQGGKMAHPELLYAECLD